MSQDYPNRDEWLAVRATHKRPAKYVHISKPIVTIKNPITGQFETVLGNGNTLRFGSTQAKQVRWDRKMAARAIRHAQRLARPRFRQAALKSAAEQTGDER